MTITGRTRDLFLGADGGGTRTRIALGDADSERVRREGTATLVDPDSPDRAVGRLVDQIRRLAADAELVLPAAGLCVGLAGTGDPAVRRAVQTQLAAAEVARRVDVVTDGELALEAAHGRGPGIVVVSGTGSVAYGRSEAGEVARCGGWGLVAGDEGSGYAIARTGLHALLRAVDGRGEATELVPRLLAALDLDDPGQVPGWSARADKAGIAALAPVVMDLAAAGDGVARQIVEEAADDLARHVETLVDRLGPWSGPAPVAFLGSVLDHPALARWVEDRLQALPGPTTRRKPRQDPVGAALDRARRL